MAFITKEEIKGSIQYFTGFDTSPNDAYLGMFFVLKGAKFTNSEKHFYDNWKLLVPQNMWLMASVYGPKEIGKQNCFLFPFSISNNIKKNSFFNPACPLRNIASRFRDTMDNSITDYYIDKQGRRKDGDEYYKYINNYLTEVKGLLNGRKIELKHLLCWVYKFLEIEDSKKELSKEDNFLFLRNKFISDFNLSPIEVDELFEQNLKSINFSEDPIEGADVRNMLSVKDDVKFDFDVEPAPPEIKAINFIKSKDVLKTIMMMSSNPSNEYLLKSLALKGQMILYGPPGTSKTFTAKAMSRSYEKTFEIQFHPNTSYQEFIGGKMVKDDATFEDRTGVLLEAVHYALSTKNNVLLIIDEINRGDITSILGEAIIALDRGYEIQIQNYLPGGKLKIPKNLHIIGTMNSSDRSISIEDKAILRRFSKVRLYPDYDLIRSSSDTSRVDNIDLGAFLKKLNHRLIEELEDVEMQIGHAYLLPDSLEKEGKYYWEEEDLLHVFNDNIMPLLEEFTVGSEDSLKRILGVDYSNRVYTYKELFDSVLTKILA